MNTQIMVNIFKGIALAAIIITSGFASATSYTVNQEKEKSQQSQSTEQNDQRININTATLEELDKLPRIGPAIGKRIIAFREEHGGFKAPEELMNVSGIGEKTFARLKDLIKVQ